VHVLLDESLPRGLAPLIAGHGVSTVVEMGWGGMQNGQLLEQASEEFDAFVTIDANLPYQQVLERFSSGVVLVRAPSNRLADRKFLVPDLLASQDGIEPGELRIVGA
jgi:hypothetical protein